MIMGPILFPDGGGFYLFMSRLEYGILDETGKFHYPHFQNLLNFVILRIENVFFYVSQKGFQTLGVSERNP